MSFRVYLSPRKIGFDQSKTKKKKLIKAFQKKGERKDKGKAFFLKKIFLKCIINHFMSAA